MAYAFNPTGFNVEAFKHDATTVSVGGLEQPDTVAGDVYVVPSIIVHVEGVEQPDTVSAEVEIVTEAELAGVEQPDIAAVDITVAVFVGFNITEPPDTTAADVKVVNYVNVAGVEAPDTFDVNLFHYGPEIFVPGVYAMVVEYQQKRVYARAEESRAMIVPKPLEKMKKTTDDTQPMTAGSRGPN